MTLNYSEYKVVSLWHHVSAAASERRVTARVDVGHSDIPLFLKEARQWMNRWLKGDEDAVPADAPRVQYFSMGDNRWRSADDWPPKPAEPFTLYMQLLQCTVQ